MKRTVYPLQWPEGWKRTTWRGAPKFVSRFSHDRDEVICRLERRGGANIVITSDLPVRNDGLPYANATTSDPGIAVYWIEGLTGKRIERVLACDKWRHINDNLRAIAKSLEALAGMERWGASQVIERAFAGFAALPPGSSGTIDAVPVKRPWREVLGGEWPRELGPGELLYLAKGRYRTAIAAAHPDAGGDVAIAAALNDAMAEAEKELAP